MLAARMQVVCRGQIRRAQPAVERTVETRVELTFLGSGDAFGSGGRYQACIFVRAPQTSFLLDCGASSLIAMKRFGIEPGAIDTIIVSHLHGDHFGGLPFFILDAQLVTRRTRPLIIAGPPGLAERTRQAQEVLFPGSSQTRQKFAIEYVELVPGQATPLGALTVTGFEVVHASGAPPLAPRVETAGKAIAYSGDTEWTDTLIAAAQDADLFICEAYFYDKTMKFHLDYATLRARRDSLGCRRLIVTHLSADLLARRAELDLEVADDGLTVVV